MSVVILDIESSNISVLVGEKGINNTYSIRANESVECYSFYKGVFPDTKELEEAITKLIVDLKEKNSIEKIDRIFVGVPGEFCKVTLKSSYIKVKKKKIVTNDILELIKNSFEEIDPEYSFIHVSPNNYLCDDIKCDYPVGMECSKLISNLSYVFVKLYFKEIIDGILHKLGINKIFYISTDYCENRYLFKSDLYSYRMLVDCGCATTSISFGYGDGLLHLRAIPYGGGIISGRLSNELGCSYFVAEELRKKINLGLSSDSLYNYCVEYENQMYTFPVEKVNSIATEVLSEMTEIIWKITQGTNLAINGNTTMSFTGGGVCYLRGAVEYIAKCLGRPYNKVAPSVPRFNQTSYSSIISLLATCLDKKDDKLFFML